MHLEDVKQPCSRRLELCAHALDAVRYWLHAPGWPWPPLVQPAPRSNWHPLRTRSKAHCARPELTVPVDGATGLGVESMGNEPMGNPRRYSSEHPLRACVDTKHRGRSSVADRRRNVRAHERLPANGMRGPLNTGGLPSQVMQMRPRQSTSPASRTTPQAQDRTMIALTHS